MSIKGYLFHVQRSLAVYSLLQVMPERAVDIFDTYMNHNSGGSLTLEDLDGAIDEQKYAHAWGKWKGREAEFYVHCYEEVCRVEPGKFDQICGIQQKLQLNRISQQLAKATAIPEVLVKSPSAVLRPHDGGLVRVGPQQHGAYLTVPRAFVECFDGQTSTSTIRDSFAAAHGVKVSDEVMLALFHYHVLKAPTGGPLSESKSLSSMTASLVESASLTQ